MLPLVRTLLLGGVAGKAIAVIRELAMAWLFGAGPAVIAYRTAQSAFLIPLNGFASEALSGGFVPRFAFHWVNDPPRARSMFAALTTSLLAIALFVGVIVYAFATPWIDFLAPGLDGLAREQAIAMLNIMVVAMPMYFATTLFAGADMVCGKGEIAAARPALQSIGLVVGTIAAWVTGYPVLIAVGFAIAYVYMSVWGFVKAREYKLPMLPRRTEIESAKSTLYEIWRSFRILLFVPIIMQVHFIVERRISSEIDAGGAIAALDYARFICDTLILLLAVPFGMAALGAMATMSQEAYRSSARTALNVLAKVGFPCAAILYINSQTIVDAIFARGAFNNQAAALTSSVLAFLGLGLWAQLIAYAGAKFLNARGDLKYVLGYTTVGIATTIVLNSTFTPSIGAAGLGISSAIGSIVLAFLLIYRIGILRLLLGDCALVAVSAIVYIVLAAIALESGMPQYTRIPCEAVFWLVVFLGPSKHRRETFNALSYLRGKNMKNEVQ